MWVRRFYSSKTRSAGAPERKLTEAHVVRFAHSYAKKHDIQRSIVVRNTRAALSLWRKTIETLGDGKVTQAAQMLYGTRFLPDYPQGLLKLGRFRGTKITGDILDNKQEHMHAFAMVREAIAWLDRTLPLSAHFPKGSIFREDRQPVPAEALREVILNAVMHRDYSRPSSYVAIAVFDDRIEVRSVGDFPTGIRAEMLSGNHPSVLRNPLIAGAFHRTGAVEVWGRGTNRVIEACRARGIALPEFSEQAGVVTVTFRAAVLPEAVTAPRHQVGPTSAPSSSAGDRLGSKVSPGTDGAFRPNGSHQVPGPSPPFPPRSRPSRDDDSRQASKLATAISDHACGSESP